MMSPRMRSMLLDVDRTVRVLCEHLEDKIAASPRPKWREYDLRKELVGCILGSRVRHQTAVAATENLDYAGLLTDRWWIGEKGTTFRSRVLEVLSGRYPNLPNAGRHRFFRSRTDQLAATRDALAESSLTQRLSASCEPKTLRQSLIADIPGLGPKQASLFLRNVGASYDLAIVDTHVLHFIEMRELLETTQARMGTLVGYERVEQVVIEYADSLGKPPGYLDWAIWATMKAVRELGL